ncbi:MAG: DEAD/DEAH box helicase [Rheinheimera sp.]|nr:MAG: DEAD/DEAH box helicase [Rheinheimera sp.]
MTLVPAAALPVADILPALVQQLASAPQVILTAPPGAGKSTYLPLYLLQQPAFAGKKIIMLEPRRLAAKSIAAYLAQQLGEAVGQTIGYQIRLEQKQSAATRLLVVTEGVLIRKMLSAPLLEDVDLLIFDEFHERSLQTDLALALALTGIILGIALRVRAFLYAGVAFLVLNVAGQLARFYPEQSLSRALILIGLGTVITVGMVVFNLKREEIMQRIRIVRADLAAWE